MTIIRYDVENRRFGKTSPSSVRLMRYKLGDILEQEEWEEIGTYIRSLIEEA